MKKRWRGFVAAVVMITFAGCATGNQANMGPCPDPTRDSARIKAGGAALGAAGGAAVGAALGQAVGENKESTLLGAAIGGVLGAVGGFAWGSTVASRKAQYKSEECRLYGETQIAKQNNEELRTRNQEMASRVKTLKYEIASLKKQYRSGKVRVGELERKKRGIENEIAQNNELHEQKKGELIALENYRNSLPGTAVSDTKRENLEHEIYALRQNIEMLDNNSIQMASMAESLNVRR